MSGVLGNQRIELSGCDSRHEEYPKIVRCVNVAAALRQNGENITTKSTKDRKKNLVFIPRLGAGTYPMGFPPRSRGPLLHRGGEAVALPFGRTRGFKPVFDIT